MAVFHLTLENSRAYRLWVQVSTHYLVKSRVVYSIRVPLLTCKLLETYSP
ncbi:hypothetical protein Patl1_11753 [Pistacia atlantica]|uniref:Uncharacterized protein n=1 Tax=Pistacia atlantica TaxID=434234 RepID=A0ACC1A005_9ROSI|nr:hypothetical protein Patl1_11753 [Pistacia atlantica]